MSIKRITEFHAQESKDEQLYTLLQSIMPYIRSSEGCVSCELLKCLDDPLKFVVLEEWDVIASHKKSVENFPAEDMQAAMSLIASAPVGAYYQR